MESNVFNKTLHQKFWTIVSNYPGHTITHILANSYLKKELETEEYELLSKALNNNLACQFAREQHTKYFEEHNITQDIFEEYPDNKIPYCTFCPFLIDDILKSCLDGLYQCWADMNHNCYTEKQIKIVKELALQIANFPVKEDVEYI